MTVIDGAGQSHLATVDPNLDLRGVDVGMLGQALAVNRRALIHAGFFSCVGTPPGVGTLLPVRYSSPPYLPDPGIRSREIVQSHRHSAATETLSSPVLFIVWVPG